MPVRPQQPLGSIRFSASEAELNIRVFRSPHGPFERILFSLDLGPTTVGLPITAQVSVYRLGDILIDSGSSHVSAALVSALTDHPPQKIILTHQHEDHVGGVTSIKKAFGDIPVYAPRDHIKIIETTDWVSPHRALCWGHPKPPKNLIPYDPGETFEAHGLTLKSFDSPGHTPGHVCLVLNWGPQVYACTGDLYFGSKFVPAFYESAADDLIASQRKIAELAPSVHMLPTHGKTRANGSEILTTSADQIEQFSEAIMKTADTIGGSDLQRIRQAHFPGEDLMGTQTHGDVSELAFVRSVLEPVRQLPAKSLAPYFKKSAPELKRASLDPAHLNN